MRKDNFLEVVKQLDSYENAKIIASFIDSLTADGFEQYVTDFFKQPQYGFSTYRNGGMNDKGIDVKAVRKNADGTDTFLIVQCKKWDAYHIKLDDVASYYGKAVKLAMQNNCMTVFIATTWLTLNAKIFCDENDIHYADYRKLLEFNTEYPLQDWIR